MAFDLSAVIEGLGRILSGPWGGLIGGVVSFFGLELGYRRLRERRDLADALAAELADNADAIHAILNDPDRDAIPPYYRTSNTVFAAVVSRLGDLPYEDIASLAKLYRFLEEYNRLPSVWNDRARRALALSNSDPFREVEMQSLNEGVEDFYRHLPTIAADCHAMAVHLRTKHVLGWRRLVPRWLRPAVPVRRELSSRNDA